MGQQSGWAVGLVVFCVVFCVVVMLLLSVTAPSKLAQWARRVRKSTVATEQGLSAGSQVILKHEV